ncbi:MAG: sigma-70 family RNA polymerase sigma factor [Deltaproteobacteria bacterium]|nr:MAG: sigma-70 family RNA polymerase sigma factor [Deltaproteobacteria bacterium]
MNTSLDEFTIARIYKLCKLIANDIFCGNERILGFDDLVSIGVEAALGAYERFDKNKGDNLNAYLRFRIRGAMIDELRKIDPYSRGMRKKIKALEEHLNQNQGVLNKDVVCEKLDIELEKLEEIRAARNFGLKIVDDEEFSLEDESTPDPNRLAGMVETRKKVASSISKLTRQEANVIRLRYFNDLNQRETSEALNMSAARVSQLEKSARQKLEEDFERKGLNVA